MNKNKICALFVTLSMSVMALSIPAQAQITVEELQSNLATVKGLVEYATGEITTGASNEQNGEYNLACEHYTNGQKALLKAANIYRQLSNNSNIPQESKDSLLSMEETLNTMASKADTRRTAVCNKG